MDHPSSRVRLEIPIPVERAIKQEPEPCALLRAHVTIDFDRDCKQEFAKAIQRIAEEVVRLDGNRRRVRTAKSLAEVLGDEFVGCTRGEQGRLGRFDCAAGETGAHDVILRSFCLGRSFLSKHWHLASAGLWTKRANTCENRLCHAYFLHYRVIIRLDKVTERHTDEQLCSGTDGR